MNVLFQQDPLYVGLFSSETWYIAGQRATKERLPSKPVEIEPVRTDVKKQMAKKE
jgi:hypothetical protein